MAMPTLQQAWETYERQVIAKEASDAQRECMRQSYFVGALTVFNQIFEGNFRHRKQEQFTQLREELASFVRQTLAADTGRKH
jgi:hypothetical protein